MDNCKINFLRRILLKLGSGEGFTIVEFIVAMFIFVTALAVGVGVFLNSLRAQRALLLDMAVNNNMNLVLEQMARDIRTGYDFAVGGSNISFKGRDGKDIVYNLEGHAVRRTVDGSGKIVTSVKVDVKDVRFIVIGRSDCEPWRVVVSLKVSPLGADKVMNIQTTVTSRVLPRDVGSEEYSVCRG